MEKLRQDKTSDAITTEWDNLTGDTDDLDMRTQAEVIPEHQLENQQYISYLAQDVPSILNRIKERAMELGGTKKEIQSKYLQYLPYLSVEGAPLMRQEYSEEDLKDAPYKRFEVNPEVFPVFRRQAIYIPETTTRHGELVLRSQELNIDECLGRHVKCTADTIAVLAGETQAGGEPADAAIYLDKSARPVSWLVDEFWQDFTDKQRPRTIHMLLDRVQWFRAVGVDVDKNGNKLDGSNDEAIYADFIRAERDYPISQSDIARARLLLIPGGIKTVVDGMPPEERAIFDSMEHSSINEDTQGTNTPRNATAQAPLLPDWLIKRIFATPTNLEGKNIVVIDEVKKSGASLWIAQEIIRRAINDPKARVSGYYYWDGGSIGVNQNNKPQMDKTPVWYDHDQNTDYGKGIGPRDGLRLKEQYLQARSENGEDAGETFAAMTSLYAEPFAGYELQTPGEVISSIELAQEIHRMAQLYRTHNILMKPPVRYDFDKWANRVEPLGVEITADEKNPKGYLGITARFKSLRP